MSNAPAFGALDDMVLKIIFPNGEKHLVLGQMKHSIVGEIKISDQFSKYTEAYEMIKRLNMDMNEISVVFITNTDFRVQREKSKCGSSIITRLINTSDALEDNIYTIKGTEHEMFSNSLFFVNQVNNDDFPMKISSILNDLDNDRISLISELLKQASHKDIWVNRDHVIAILVKVILKPFDLNFNCNQFNFSPSIDEVNLVVNTFKKYSVSTLPNTYCNCLKFCLEKFLSNITNLNDFIIDENLKNRFETISSLIPDFLNTLDILELNLTLDINDLVYMLCLRYEIPLLVHYSKTTANYILFLLSRNLIKQSIILLTSDNTEVPQLENRFYNISNDDLVAQIFTNLKVSLNAKNMLNFSDLLQNDMIENILKTISPNVFLELLKGINLNKPMEMNINYIERSVKQQFGYKNERELLSAEEKVFIISGNAGLGKTTLLKKIRILSSPLVWSLYIDLKLHFEELNKFSGKYLELINIEQKIRDLEHKDTDTCKELKELKSKKEDIQQTFIKYLIETQTNIADSQIINCLINLIIFLKNRGMVLLLMDGFDEVDLKMDIVNLVSKLDIRIIITTRNYKTIKLEKILDTKAWELTKFSKEDKIHYLSLAYSSTDKKTLTKVVEELDTMVNPDVMGIPLQLKMFTEIFKTLEDYEKEKEKISELYLFNEYINRHLEKYKSNVSKSQLKMFACRLLFTDDVLKDVLTIYIEDLQDIIKEYKIVNEKDFILTGIRNQDTVEFTHGSFAEFLSAQLIVERVAKYLDTCKDKSKYNDFLKMLHENGSYRNVLRYLNLILTEELPLHYAIVNGNINQILKLREQRYAIKRDKFGRTAAHLLCFLGKRHILGGGSVKIVNEYTCPDQDTLKSIIRLIASFKMFCELDSFENKPFKYCLWTACYDILDEICAYYHVSNIPETDFNKYVAYCIILKGYINLFIDNEIPLNSILTDSSTYNRMATKMSITLNCKYWVEMIYCHINVDYADYFLDYKPDLLKLVVLVKNYTLFDTILKKTDTILFKDCNQAIRIALANKSRNFAEHLITLTDNINDVDVAGDTLVHFAVKVHSPCETIKCLINAGSNLALTNWRGDTAIDSTTIIYKTNFEIVVKNILSGTNFVWFQVIKRCIEPRMIQTLSEVGVDIVTPNEMGRTLLHELVLKKKVKYLELYTSLAELGVDKNAKDVDGSTALHLLIEQHHRNIKKEITKLIKIGVNVNEVNGKGLTALDLVKTERFNEKSLIKLLQDNGAEFSCENTETPNISKKNLKFLKQNLLEKAVLVQNLPNLTVLRLKAYLELSMKENPVQIVKILELKNCNRFLIEVALKADVTKIIRNETLKTFVNIEECKKHLILKDLKFVYEELSKSSQ
ncbi:uncharacterized protein LOC109602530 isoform X2 [Aethina tumida]|nr:uncharacterized protein LOC109602530 isoform X2 [Aethina tumida]